MAPVSGVEAPEPLVRVLEEEDVIVDEVVVEEHRLRPLALGQRAPLLADPLEQRALDAVREAPHLEQDGIHEPAEAALAEAGDGIAEIAQIDERDAERRHRAVEKARVARGGLRVLLDEEAAALDPEVRHPARDLEDVGEAPAAALCFGEHRRGPRTVVARGDRVELEHVGHVALPDVPLDEVSRRLEETGDVVLEIGARARDSRQRNARHGEASATSLAEAEQEGQEEATATILSLPSPSGACRSAPGAGAAATGARRGGRAPFDGAEAALAWGRSMFSVLLPPRVGLIALVVSLPFVGSGGCGSRTACFEYSQPEYFVNGNSCPAQSGALSNFSNASCPGPVVSVDGPGTFDGELCCYPVTYDSITPDCGGGGTSGRAADSPAPAAISRPARWARARGARAPPAARTATSPSWSGAPRAAASPRRTTRTSRRARVASAASPTTAERPATP